MLIGCAEDAQRDLDMALPALDAAVASLKNLSRNDVVEVKSMQVRQIISRAVEREMPPQLRCAKRLRHNMLTAHARPWRFVCCCPTEPTRWREASDGGDLYHAG